MRFSLSAASAAMVMATSAFAQETTLGFDPVTSPSANETVTGKTFPITWTHDRKYDGVKVKIELIGGHYQNGQTHRGWVTRESEGETIPNEAGTYTWTVGSEHGELPCYGLKIISSNGTYLQYSPPFFIGSKKNCPKTLDGASTAVSSTGASSATSTAPAASGYSVGTSAVAPKATGAGSTHQANVDCIDKNATGIAKAGTPGAGAGAGAGTPATAAVAGSAAGAGTGPGAARPSTGLTGRPTNTTTPVTTGAAPLVQAGFLSVFGGVVAVALAL